ncbi:phenoloxidase-activating factor 2-like [Drosophila biarmipes]|uniref:phenoloxidase-activating factor 2-like n=1 Tax=Drosophila biarmipes TaxID=125945 RepID=UPI0007E6C0AB|nr:phenoloxidase-activating factor 2-like [Drosophila biarmipes]
MIALVHHIVDLSGKIPQLLFVLEDRQLSAQLNTGFGFVNQIDTKEPPARCVLYESPKNPTKVGLENQPCGKSNSKEYMKRFISGNQVTPGEYPWVVALFKNGKFWAGGSLIAPGVVLTAAHRVKFEQKDDIVVRAGEWDFNSNIKGFQYEERGVKKVVCHERFDYQSGANNLALLFLKSKFQLKEHIRTICLPTPKTSFEGHRCIVAGWRKTNITHPSHASVLNKADLPMISRNKCEQQLKLTKLGWKYQLPQGIICAGGELNQDACFGDGGSPLFCPVGDRFGDIYIQVGIVNFGMSCGLENVPGMYTDVAMFREWIDDNLLEFNYN